MKNGKRIFVYPGVGYTLQELNLHDYDSDSIAINEIAFLCYCQNKGYLIPFNELNNDEISEYFNDERFVYCDISEYLENNNIENQYFLCIENMRVENIEIC